ncbi:DUF3492 domain-containing protein [Aliifodinibius sp. S!AR15-10]|uniref:DUF3492 domain-containing protein n=1 Tax=Aliifodinibius sp. S!AR15-10 TaxID=2950437 RepID=UPI00285A8552|nr:DUF3492 domain-containing protein [Aliifodinibius sp. S!AR15-10]MDR8391009.1 DUF3492 domain-containing protein [Aliifodinibius sp. S!AR15-10]
MMSVKPRILLVIEGTYPWYRGGVSEWVYQYITAFDHVAFTIVQIATDEFQYTALDEALYNVPDHVTRFIRIPPPDISQDWEQDSSKWLQEHQEKMAHAFDEADCVHIANTGFAGWLGMTLAAKSGKPLILTEHALYWKEVKMGAVALECGYKIPDHKTGKLYITTLFKGIASSVYKAADEVISVSECNISEQESLGAQQVQYIPNGVGADWIKAGKSRSKTFTVGWIGRCAEMKNPLRFFEFFNAVDIEAKGLMMLSDAGEDQLKRRVKKRAEEYANIELVWNRPAAERIDEMDALCITSHNESQPLVLFEALSRQVLPVGWQIGDVSEKYAVVVEPQSPVEELAKKITTLWEYQPRWQSELAKRFAEFKKYHTWQAIFDQYNSVLEPYLKTS